MPDEKTTMWTPLAAIALLPLLPACAANLLDAARLDCNAYGFQPGSDAFALCVERGYARRREDLAALARAAPPPAPPPTDAPPRQFHPPQAGIAFFKSQTVEGMSRICTYERIGGPYVITIHAAEICPLSIH